MKSSEPGLRIPAVLMPSYLKVNRTEEGRSAEKRVRVHCGICKEIRYYSVYRGVTRIAGTILACEACRHSYQKFKRKPSILSCNKKGKCYVLGDNSKTRCKACWIAHILRICPISDDMYIHLLKHLPDKIRDQMEDKPRVMDDIPEEERGSLGLEIKKGEDDWDDITDLASPQQTPQPEPIEENEEVEDGMDDKTLDSYFEAETSRQAQPISTVAPTSQVVSIPNTATVAAPQAPELNNITISILDNRVIPINHTNGVKPQVEVEPVKWWVADSVPFSIPVTSGTQTYFNMSNMSASDGLTPLTPLQPVEAVTFTTLAPMNPVEIPQEQQPIENHTEAFFTIKQDGSEVHDLESQEARLFQNIGIKQEYYQPVPVPEVDLQMHTSPYFSQDGNSQIQVTIGNQQQVTANVAVAKVEPEVPVIESPVETKPVILAPKIVKKYPKVKVEENGSSKTLQTIIPEPVKRPAPEASGLDMPPKQKKKVDRFDGMPEEEVAKKFLPDHLGPNMDILIIGINPGLFAAHKGHHYAGPGNHFWKCMYLSGLIPEPFTAFDDFRLLDYGIGFTNIVARTTRGSADLTKDEIKKGGEILLTKIRKYQPLIAVFNGKGIYEIFSGKKQFNFGKQPEKVDGTNTHIWVMPSSSARCAQLPRALDKVPFYIALRKYREYLKGNITEIDEEEITFSNVRLSNPKTPVKQEAKSDPDDFREPKKVFKSEPTKGLKALKKTLRNEQTKVTVKSENPS